MRCKYYLIIFITILVYSEKTQSQIFSDSSWVKLNTSVTGDFVKNISGGIKNNYTYVGMEDIILSMDMEKAGLLKGGEFLFHGLNTHGNLPSEELVGDLQILSNIESGNYIGFYEYYFKQKINNFTFILGQHDLNTEFIGTEYGGTFINSSFGIAPTISLNVPVSIYPVAAPAFIIKYEKDELYVAKAGIYDGDPGDFESNRYNLQWNTNSDEGYFLISEIEFKSNFSGNKGCYKIGSFFHTGDFVDYRDTLKSQKGNFGFYFISDQVLWTSKANSSKYLGAFLQAGYSLSNYNFIDFYLGGGLHFNGTLPQRFEDVVGLAFAYAKISNVYKNIYSGYDPGELAIELTYKFRVFDFYTIQPNLQYIINPGANPDLNNALVALMRFNITLD